ncbi:hypothetical protein B0H14DRAFT_2637207, partial [Mycena olivaceomarginata]
GPDMEPNVGGNIRIRRECGDPVAAGVRLSNHLTIHRQNGNIIAFTGNAGPREHVLDCPYPTQVRASGVAGVGPTRLRASVEDRTESEAWNQYVAKHFFEIGAGKDEVTMAENVSNLEFEAIRCEMARWFLKHFRSATEECNMEIAKSNSGIPVDGPATLTHLLTTFDITKCRLAQDVGMVFHKKELHAQIRADVITFATQFVPDDNTRRDFTINAVTFQLPNGMVLSFVPCP